MKRDKHLMRLLLLQVRDGVESEDLKNYPEELRGYNAALLVEDGYVTGSAVKGRTGQYIGAALVQLTSKGHDYLEEVERASSITDQASLPSNMPSNINTIEVFVSHSGKDEKLAAALIDLIIVATNVPHDKIRCTSVDGYRLPGGANTDEQLKREIRDSKCFIGLLTPNSLRSPYVMFELGARWGAELLCVPLMAAGITSADLKRPLSLLLSPVQLSDAPCYC